MSATSRSHRTSHVDDRSSASGARRLRWPLGHRTRSTQGCGTAPDSHTQYQGHVGFNVGMCDFHIPVKQKPFYQSIRNSMHYRLRLQDLLFTSEATAIGWIGGQDRQAIVCTLKNFFGCGLSYLFSLNRPLTRRVGWLHDIFIWQKNQTSY